MLVKYPTGFYKDELPSEPSDSGNVTFLISNKAPNRTDLLYTKIPLGVTNRKLDPKSNTRSAKGPRLFSVSSSTQTNSDLGDRQYILGEVLEFEDVVSSTMDPMLVTKTTQIQHNSNAINYELLNLSAADVLSLQVAVETQQAVLIAQLNSIRSERASLEITISSRQKQINDIDRAINATQIANQSGALNDIISKLTEQKNALYEQMRTDVTAGNALAGDASVVLDKLRAIGVVLK